jgi:hypothetical protein
MTATSPTRRGYRYIVLGRGTRVLVTSCLVAICLGFAANAAPAAGGGSFYGVGSVTYPTAGDFQRMARAGARTLRVQFNWQDVEPTAGARNWGVPDAIVAESARSGVRLLPILYGTPPWLSSNTTYPPIRTPQARAAWSAYTTDLALRYGSNGSFWAQHPELPRVPITDWQIWNEVNLRFYWGAKPNARDYADLLGLTRPALRAGDPASRLILSGLIPFKAAGVGSVGGERYLQRLLKLRGVRRLFDVVAIHPYGRTPRLVLKSLIQTRKALDNLGAHRLPIWVTEFGWSTGGRDWSTSPLRATPARQARNIRDAYKGMRKLRKQLLLRKAFYFCFSDFDQFGPDDDWTSRMGLLDVGGQPKPGWYAYARQAGGKP